MLVPRPTCSHVAGAAPKRRAPDALSLNLRAGISPQQRNLDLQEIQSWFQSGSVQGGLWLPDWAYLAQDSAMAAVTAAGQVTGIFKDATWDGQLGPELVANGTFSSDTLWIKNPGWRIESGIAICESSATSGMYSTLSASPGRLYKLQFTVLENNGVGLNTIFLGSTNLVSNVHLPVGNVTLYTGSVSGDAAIQFFGRAGERFVIDNVSVREVLGNHATQTTTANKPLSAITPQTQLPWLTADATDVTPVVFPSALGSACTIARATPTGVEFTDSQTVNATWNDLIRPYQYNSAVCVLNRAPTAYERAVISRVLGRYVPVLGGSIVVNGGFDVDANWMKESGWSISNGVAVGNNTSGGIYQGPTSGTGVGTVIGKAYYATFDAAITSGSTKFRSSTYYYSMSQTGTYALFFIADSVNLHVFGTAFTGTVDNVSVREII